MIVELTKKTASDTDKRAKRISEFKKNATIEMLARSPQGLKKIAAVLSNPVRKHLDYVGIGRRVVITEPQADGQVAYFDRDIDEWSGVKIAEDGTSLMLIIKSRRTILEPFELMTKPKVPFKELRLRKYKVFDRMKARLKQGLQIREDLLWLALFHASAVLTNTQVTDTTDITKAGLTKAFYQVDKHRLVTTSVIMDPSAVAGIRTWQRDYIDEVARIEIRRTGYLGNLYGANFYVTNLLEIDSDGYQYTYCLASPEFLAWNPIWADGEVVPADRPDDNLLGLNGYELMSMIVHNSYAVSRLRFKPSVS